MAFKLFVLFGFCVFANGRFLRRPTLDGRIVGGADADIEDYPYQVSMLYLDEHTCGASIISDHWVLTAAHCVDGKMARHVKVRAGSSIRDDGGYVYTVADIVQHLDYDADSYDYDYALLKLDTPIAFGSNVQPIKLTSEEPAAGSVAIVSGWGRLSSSGGRPEQLQVVSVPIVDRARCNQVYGTITDRMICAGYDEGGKDACQGDSGGPLVSNKELIGVVSWGIGCAEPNQPGVYSSVAHQRAWIKENCENCI